MDTFGQVLTAQRTHICHIGLLVAEHLSRDTRSPFGILSQHYESGTLPKFRGSSNGNKVRLLSVIALARSDVQPRTFADCPTPLPVLPVHCNGGSDRGSLKARSLSVGACDG